MVFTDRKVAADRATVVKEFVPSGPDSRRRAKRYKILPHKYTGTPSSLWIDGSVQCLPGAVEAFAQSDCDMKVFRLWPPWDADKTVYNHGATCIKLGKDDPEVIDAQLARYRADGLGPHTLMAGTILFRKHTTEVINFCELWWGEIENGSVRDQISFPYVAWKTGIKVEYVDALPKDLGFIKRRHLA